MNLKKYLLLNIILLQFCQCKDGNKSSSGVIKQKNIDPNAFPINMGTAVKTSNSLMVHSMLSPKSIAMSQTISDTNAVEALTHFSYYTDEDGIASNIISCSYYDRKGNLWFGTLGSGVSKFNGKNFTHYSTINGLTNNNIKCIKEDKKGNIWIGTDGGGINKYDGRKFTNYNTIQNLASNTVNCIAEDNKGNLWFGTAGGGLSKFVENELSQKATAKNFINYNTSNGLGSNYINAIGIDYSGNIWMGLKEGGLSKFDGVRFYNYPIENGLNVLSIYFDKSDVLWVGCNKATLIKYYSNDFIAFHQPNWPSNLEFRNIVQDKFGNIWAATNYGILKSSNKKFKLFDKSNGLNNTNIYCINTDKTGCLWLGTFGGNIVKYEGQNFTNYLSLPGGDYHSILTQFKDKNGSFWYGTDGVGIIKFNGAKYINYAFKGNNAYNTINCIVATKNTNKDERDEAIWFGTKGSGLIKYDGKQFINYTAAQGLANNTINCSMCDKRGNLWFGTDGGGVSKFDGETFTNYTVNESLASNVILSIYEDRNSNIWFGSNGKGLTMYDGKNFITYTKQDGLAGNIILNINENKIDKKDNDKVGNIRLMVGTDNGLSLLNLDKQNKIGFKNYTTYNGLPDNYIVQVLQNFDAIMVGTKKGIAVFNPSLPSYSNGKAAQLEVFNKTTGYNIQDIVCGQNATYQDADGTVFISTSNPNIGLVKFNRKEIYRNYDKPIVQFKNIKLNNENVCWYSLKNSAVLWDSATMAQQQVLSYGKTLSQNELDSVRTFYRNVKFSSISKDDAIPLNLEIPHKHNNINITFGCNEVNNNFLINYQYILEGYNNNWSQPSNNTEASFGNINVGTYTFKVKAQSSNGIWGPITSYTFTVLPPWYSTWWAYILYIVSTFGSLFLIYKVRTNALIKQQKYLEALVIERTIEVHAEKKEVEKQKEVIENQKKIVEEKQTQILDSINYAKRIQESILIPENEIKKIASGIFVYYVPKDIVSGDFYWFAKLGDEIILVVADCTGHGVPGAFLSMVGSTLLNEIVHHDMITDPAEIIKGLAKGVSSTLVSKSIDDSNTDGMDISVLKINKNDGKCFFAGVNQKLVIVSQNEISHIEAQINSIRGIFEMNYEEDLKSISIDIEKNDMIYLLTDGYADQRGEATGKNFFESRLDQLLIDISLLDLEKQKQELENNFNHWKGRFKQSDDVLIIGVRV